MNELSTVALILWYIEKVWLKYHGWFNLFGCRVLRRLIHLSSWDSTIDVIFSSGLFHFLL